jgi:hypothetical protein
MSLLQTILLILGILAGIGLIIFLDQVQFFKPVGF